MAVALIVAAGGGERLAAGRPKAFVALAGKAMVDWSVAAMRAVPEVEAVVVALPPGESAPEGTVGAAGGATRSQSVRAALRAAPPGDPVVVHDAARPLVEPGAVRAVLAELEASGADAAVAAAPVSDTVKRARDGEVLETLDRSQLWSIQTPQAFRRSALERALEAGDDVLAAATDDAWLVERAGGRVRIVAHELANLKVTTADDLRYAESLLRARC